MITIEENFGNKGGIEMEQRSKRQNEVMDSSEFGKGGWFSHRGDLFRKLEEYHKLIESDDFDINNIQDISNQFELLENLQKECEKYLKIPSIKHKTKGETLKIQIENKVYDLANTIIEKIDNFSTEQPYKILLDIKILIEKNKTLISNNTVLLGKYNKPYEYMLMKIEYRKDVILTKRDISKQEFKKEEIIGYIEAAENIIDTNENDKFKIKVTEYFNNNSGDNNELGKIFELEKECEEFLKLGLDHNLQEYIENFIISLNTRKKEIIPSLKNEQIQNNNDKNYMNKDYTSELRPDPNKEDIDLSKYFNDLIASDNIELERIPSIEKILEKYNKSKNDSNKSNIYTNQVIKYSCLLELEKLSLENDIEGLKEKIEEEKNIISNNNEENSKIYEYAARSYEIEKYVKANKVATNKEVRENEEFKSFFEKYDESYFEKINKSTGFFKDGSEHEKEYIKLNVLLGKLREEEIMGKLNDNDQDELLKNIIQEIDNYKGEYIPAVTGSGPAGYLKDNRYLVTFRMFNPFNIDRVGNVNRLERDTIHELTHPTVQHKFNSDAVAFPIHILESQEDIELLKKVIRIRTEIIKKILDFISTKAGFDEYIKILLYAKRMEYEDKGLKIHQIIRAFDDKKISDYTNIKVLCDRNLRKAYALLLTDSYIKKDNLSERYSSVLAEYDSVINELYLYGQINGFYNDEENNPINKFFRAIKIVAQDAYDYRNAYKKSETEDGQRALDEEFKTYVRELDEQSILQQLDSIFNETIQN